MGWVTNEWKQGHVAKTQKKKKKNSTLKIFTGIEKLNWPFQNDGNAQMENQKHLK